MLACSDRKKVLIILLGFLVLVVATYTTFMTWSADPQEAPRRDRVATPKEIYDRFFVHDAVWNDGTLYRIGVLKDGEMTGDEAQYMSRVVEKIVAVRGVSPHQMERIRIGGWLTGGKVSWTGDTGEVVARAIFRAVTPESSGIPKSVADLDPPIQINKYDKSGIWEYAKTAAEQANDALPPIVDRLSDMMWALNFPSGFFAGNVQLSSDGKYLAASSPHRGIVKIITVGDFRNIGEVSADAIDLSFSPDGSQLGIVAASDGTYRALRFSPASGDQISTPYATAGVPKAMSISPNRVAILDEDWGIEIWNLASGQKIRRTTEETLGAGGMVFSPSGRWLAVSGTTGHGDTHGGVWILDLSDLTLAPLILYPSGTRQDNTTALAFSPDERYLAAGFEYGGIEVFDLSAEEPDESAWQVTGLPVSHDLPFPRITEIAFSRNGKRIHAAVEAVGGNLQEVSGVYRIDFHERNVVSRTTLADLAKIRPEYGESLHDISVGGDIAAISVWTNLLVLQLESLR